MSLSILHYFSTMLSFSSNSVKNNLMMLNTLHFLSYSNHIISILFLIFIFVKYFYKNHLLLLIFFVCILIKVLFFLNAYHHPVHSYSFLSNFISISIIYKSKQVSYSQILFYSIFSFFIQYEL